MVVLAGTGDNGGDALYAGALLARRGAAVTAHKAGPKAHAGSLAELRAAGGRVTADLATAGAVLSRADLVVDGILGIGGRGGLREPAASRCRRGVQRRARRPGDRGRVDLPSGVDADTGAVTGMAVRADITVTFGVLKPGLLVGAGAVHADSSRWSTSASSPPRRRPRLLRARLDDVAAWWPRPVTNDNKYPRGVVGVATGSEQFPGAAVLATGGAVRGGAGMVRVVTGPVPAAAVRQAWPDGAHHLPRRPGLGPDRIGGAGAGLGGRAGHGDRPPDAVARLASVLRPRTPRSSSTRTG